jgi:hypothetical protein
LQLRGVQAPHGAADLPDAAQEIGDFNLCKGERKFRRGLPGWCVQQANSKLVPCRLNL